MRKDINMIFTDVIAKKALSFRIYIYKKAFFGYNPLVKILGHRILKPIERNRDHLRATKAADKTDN